MIFDTLTDVDLTRLYELQQRADFQLFLRLLHDKITAATQSFPRLIDSPESQALYNKQQGFIDGVNAAIEYLPALLQNYNQGDTHASRRN